MPSTGPDEPARPETGAFGRGFRAEATPRLPGYAVEAVLGAGGHSTVYLARDAAGAVVAVKRWRGADWSEAARRRARREVEALRALDHPHLVRFLALAEDEAGDPCLVMEAVRGPTLAAAIAEEGPLAPERALALAWPLLAALEHLAARGLVHRDVKPANVVLREPDGLPVLVDLSIVKATAPDAPPTETLTRPGAGLGTAAYMAPEQCAGDIGPVDARTDVYGFGALLFHALVGVPPWSGESGWERTRRNPWLQPYPTDPERRARVERARAATPAPLGRVVARCLQGDPRKRYPDARNVAQALRGRGPGVRRGVVAAASLAVTAAVAASWISSRHSAPLGPSDGQRRETPAEEAMIRASSSPLPAAVAAVTTAVAGGAAAQETPPPDAPPRAGGAADAAGDARGPEAARLIGQALTRARDAGDLGRVLGERAFRLAGSELATLVTAEGALGRHDGEEVLVYRLRIERADAEPVELEGVMGFDGRLRQATTRLAVPGGEETTYDPGDVEGWGRAVIPKRFALLFWAPLYEHLPLRLTGRLGDLVGRDVSDGPALLETILRYDDEREVQLVVVRLTGAAGAGAAGDGLVRVIAGGPREGEIEAGWLIDEGRTLTPLTGPEAEGLRAELAAARRAGFLPDGVSRDDIAAVVLDALRTGDADRLRVVLRPERPELGPPAAASLHRVRVELFERGLDPARLELRRACDEARDAIDASRREETTLYLEVACDGKTAVVVLDDCVRAGGYWWLTDALGCADALPPPARPRSD